MAGLKQITVDTTFEVSGELYDDIEALNDSDPTAVEDIMKDAIADMYGIDPADITITSITFASISVQFVYKTSAVVANNTFSLAAKADASGTTPQNIVQSALVTAANSSVTLKTDSGVATYSSTHIEVAEVVDPQVGLEVLTDSDGDGIEDSQDPDLIDSDGDGTVDAQDPDQMDSDGDGVVDSQDPDMVDSDGDGVVDSQDDQPNDPNVTVDADGDGIDDSEDLDQLDTDADGVVDASDHFPDDATKTSALDEYDVYGVAPYKSLYKSFDFVSASYPLANGTYFLQTVHRSLGEIYRISTYDNDDDSTKYTVSWNSNANRYDLNHTDIQTAQPVSHNGYLDTDIINGYAVTNIVRQDGPNPAYVQETIVDGVTKYTYPLYKNTYLVGDHLAPDNPPRYHKHEINGETYYMPDAPLANHAVDSKTPAISNLAEYTADLDGVTFSRVSYNSVTVGNESYYDRFTTPSFFTLSLADGVNVILSRTTEPEKQTLIGVIDNSKRIYFMPGWSFANKTSDNPNDPISGLDLIYTAPDLKTIS